MACRACIAMLVTTAVLLAGAPSGASTPTALTSYYLARADPRLCPSPMCGGMWVNRLNTRATVCGDGAEQGACYAASADFSSVRVAEKGRARLQRLITEGRAIARGRLVPGL